MSLDLSEDTCHCTNPQSIDSTLRFDLTFMSSLHVEKSPVKLSASAKKVRKSVDDESNSIAAQQREDRRRRLCK